MKMTLVIDEKNAASMYEVFDQVEKISTCKSVNDFYCFVEPMDAPIGEVFCRLDSRHQKMYKEFLLSGEFIVQFGRVEQFCYGRIKPEKKTASLTVYVYDEYEQKNLDPTYEEISWDLLIEMDRKRWKGLE